MVDKLKSALKHLMKSELTILNSFAEEEEQIRVQFEDKNWNQLEKLLKRLENHGSTLNQTEAERHHTYNQILKIMNLKENTGFYQFISRLPAEERTEWGDLYRELKTALIRWQTVTLSVDNYLRVIGSVVKGALEELIPSTKGRLYSQNGRERNGSVTPLVFDRML